MSWGDDNTENTVDLEGAQKSVQHREHSRPRGSPEKNSREYTVNLERVQKRIQQRIHCKPRGSSEKNTSE